MTNPDPSAAENEDYVIRSKRSTVFSESDSVTFIPDNGDKENGSGQDEEPYILGTVEEVKFEIKDEL